MINRCLIIVAMLSGLTACGWGKPVDYTCDDPQSYQLVTEGKRIESPDGLNPLNEFMEMPIPEAEDAPERPPGLPCIDMPPSVLTDN